MASEFCIYHIHAQTGDAPIAVIAKRMDEYLGLPFSPEEAEKSALPENRPAKTTVYASGADQLPNAKIPVKVTVHEAFVEVSLVGHVVGPTDMAELVETTGDAGMSKIPAATIEVSLAAGLITQAQASAAYQRHADMYISGDMGGDGIPIHAEVLARMTGS